GLGDDAPHDTHFVTSGAIIGDAAHAGARSAQHLWPDGRYRRPDAESRADYLRVRVVGNDTRWRSRVCSASANQYASNRATLGDSKCEVGALARARPLSGRLV